MGGGLMLTSGLLEWLTFIKSRHLQIGIDKARSEFVVGLYERGLDYHYDDDPADCLAAHNLSDDELTLIRDIVDFHYCEEMFKEANKLIGDIAL